MAFSSAHMLGKCRTWEKAADLFQKALQFTGRRSPKPNQPNPHRFTNLSPWKRRTAGREAFLRPQRQASPAGARSHLQYTVLAARHTRKVALAYSYLAHSTVAYS